MKKIILTVLGIAPLFAYSQVPQETGSPNRAFKWLGGGYFDKVLSIPEGDTQLVYNQNIGAPIIRKTTNKKLYYFDGLKWVELFSGTVGDQNLDQILTNGNTSNKSIVLQGQFISSSNGVDSNTSITSQGLRMRVSDNNYTDIRPQIGGLYGTYNNVPMFYSTYNSIGFGNGNPGSYVSNIGNIDLTANRIYQLPDREGTIALLGHISDSLKNIKGGTGIDRLGDSLNLGGDLWSNSTLNLAGGSCVLSGRRTFSIVGNCTSATVGASFDIATNATYNLRTNNFSATGTSIAATQNSLTLSATSTTANVGATVYLPSAHSGTKPGFYVGNSGAGVGGTGILTMMWDTIGVDRARAYMPLFGNVDSSTHYITAGTEGELMVRTLPSTPSLQQITDISDTTTHAIAAPAFRAPTTTEIASYGSTGASFTTDGFNGLIQTLGVLQVESGVKLSSSGPVIQVIGQETGTDSNQYLHITINGSDAWTPLLTALP